MVGSSYTKGENAVDLRCGRARHKICMLNAYQRGHDPLELLSSMYYLLVVITDSSPTSPSAILLQLPLVQNPIA